MQIKRDIQGVRALAVLLVIANHLYPHQIAGGYIGVDIFFALSGYLITGQLLQREGISVRRGIRDFYASRIRRILPSALLTILVTDYFAFSLLGPIEGLRVNKDGFWSTLFLANNWFNSVKLDYFGNAQAISLLQHYWSLAVEEQFYIFWPIVLLSSLLLLRKKRVLVKVLPILILGTSLCCAALEIHRGVPTSYLATATRIWELMAGALLAIWAPNGREIRSLPHLKSASFITLVGIAFIYTDHTGVPGLATIPVILATVVLVTPGHTGRPLSALLENKVSFYIGAISYVLYLWHWPVIALWEKYQGSSLHGSQPLLAVVLAFTLSVLTHHLVENPIRFSPYLLGKPYVSICGGLTLIALTIGIIQWVRVAHGV